MVCMTWQAILGTGVQTGMMRITTIATHLLVTRKGRILAIPGCRVGEDLIPLLAVCVLLSAATAIRMSGMATKVFVVCQGYLLWRSRLTSVRA